MGRYASRDKQNLSDVVVIDTVAIKQIKDGLNIPGEVSDYLEKNPAKLTQVEIDDIVKLVSDKITTNKL